MDATRRWETEALRSSSQGRPKPSRTKAAERSSTDWVTLKEAEAATGVPTNTLRKWVRKDTVPSYLESEGEFVLRMVDLDAVKARAKKLGRRVEPTDAPRPTPHAPRTEADAGQAEIRVALTEEDEAPSPPASQFPEDPATLEVPPETMLVPVDAWNKMLAQLGNLHEAGQQLADARERAAKAETEATFLRERLSELRDTPEAEETTDNGHRTPESETSSSPESEPPVPREPEAPEATTTYWRYLTTGWRDRRRTR